MSQDSYDFFTDLNIFFLIESQHLDQLEEMLVVDCFWFLEDSLLDENLQLGDEISGAEAETVSAIV